MTTAFNSICIRDCRYAEGLLFQETWFDKLLERKQLGQERFNSLLFVEHAPVYTLGKSGDESNLKVSIEETEAEFYRTSRGGDITYHGPGQWTIYPIFDLDYWGIGVKEYVFRLEEAIIDYLKSKKIASHRVEGASGVWLNDEENGERKICAVGIKISQGVSMHGLAFNVNTDLAFYDNIIPCGIPDKAVTSLAKELGKDQNMLQVQKELQPFFEKQFPAKD